LSLLVPTHRAWEASHGIDQIDVARANAIRKTYDIFSILQSHRIDLSEASVWHVAETILEESEKYSLDPMLILAIINVESSFRHRAVSPRGARGLMQIRPFVADALVTEMEFKRWEGKEGLDDPITNIKLGIFYLASLRERFGDLKVALTAYQWGPTEIKTRLERRETLPVGYARRVLSSYSGYTQQTGQEQRELPAS